MVKALIELPTIPGFEYTGEYVKPKYGQYFLNCLGEVAYNSQYHFAMTEPRHILKKTTQTVTLELDIPNGYEVTGEYRSPKQGECYLNTMGEKPTAYMFLHPPHCKCIILKKVET